MKFLILSALVALAAAAPAPQEYHDDVFHFSSLKGLNPSIQQTVKQTTFVKQVQPVQTTFVKQVQPVQTTFVKQVQPVQTTYVKQVQQPSFVVKSAPVVSQFVQQPAVYSHHHVVENVQEPAYAQHFIKPSVLVRTVEQEVPAVSQIETHHVHQPAVYAQVNEHVHQVAPAVSPAVVSTRTSVPEVNFKIIKQVQEFDPSGFYRFNFATENGITTSEQGTLKDVEAKEGLTPAKEGSYSYTGPDGVVYTVNYIADENGFRAFGEHLPVAPEVPAEIQRSLEILATQPEQYDEEGNLKH